MRDVKPTVFARYLVGVLSFASQWVMPFMSSGPLHNSLRSRNANQKLVQLISPVRCFERVQEDSSPRTVRSICLLRAHAAGASSMSVSDGRNVGSLKLEALLMDLLDCAAMRAGHHKSGVAQKISKFAWVQSG